MNEGKKTLSQKLIAQNRFWSYEIKPDTIVPDDILIEKTLLYLDLDDIDLLFKLFPAAKIKQVWRERLAVQGDYYRRLNRFLAWKYFGVKQPALKKTCFAVKTVNLKTEKNKNKMKPVFVIFNLFFCLMPLATAQITVATYNLRYDNVDDSIQNNGWKQRCPVICNLIAFHDFDILGTQEGKAHQLKDMQNALPDYHYIGIGRDDGKEQGEFSAIFYKTNKIKLLDTGNFWLSENTEIPNIGWDAHLPRICTWGEFEEIETGFQFYFFNLHADHRGVEARKNTAKLLLEKIKSLDGKPAILTGDFNETQYSETYRILNQSGLVKDACESAKIRYTHSGTFTGFIFKPEDNPAVDPSSLTADGRIDHIFLTPQFTVERCGILSDTYRRLKHNAASNHEYETRLPSDHYPVMAQLSHSAFHRYQAPSDSVQKPVKAVFLGHSITDNWYKTHPDFFTENGFIGHGVGGQTTSEMLVRFQADVIDWQPKTVVILAGINDIARNNGPLSHEQILQNIQSMCELAKIHKIKPILCSVLPAGQIPRNKAWSPAEDVKLLNEKLKKYAADHKIPYVDYHSALADERGELPQSIAEDGIHPNKNGYAIMETLILKTLKK